jgi:hypothetical protein
MLHLFVSILVVNCSNALPCGWFGLYHTPMALALLAFEKCTEIFTIVNFYFFIWHNFPYATYRQVMTHL